MKSTVALPGVGSAPGRKSNRDASEKPRAGVKSLRITVLSGGPGGEREVSLQSGRAVHEALGRLGHRVVTADINPNNLGPLEREADLVFIALHGEFGEDGTVQRELDRRGIAYTGSGEAASRLAMNKVEAKKRFQSAGIPTPAFEHVTAGCLREVADRFEVPTVVKPVSSGSSVDTCIARTREALSGAAGDVVRRYGEALVEQYISGRELTVGVLGDDALPVCEIRTRREFYDYQAKYVDDDTQYLFDLDLSPATLREVQRMSILAHRSLGCEVFSRVDWMIDRDTGQPFALEVNTIPGFTSHSLVPKAAGRIGLSFDALCQRIIELSLAKPRLASG